MTLRKSLATCALALGLMTAIALTPTTGAAAPRVAEHGGATHGSWTNVGPLPHPAEFQTAVRLQNGRALTFASYTSSDAPNCLRTADLFNPKNNRWSTAASMHVSRCGASAVVLRSGRVLVAGGSVWPYSTGPSYRRSAEIYHPKTDRWSSAGPMHQRRTHGAMAVLPGGRVLIAGGYHRGGSLAEAEVYNPRTDRWSVTDSLAASRDVWTRSTATLPNGDILVAGGHFDIWDPHWHGHYLRTAERYVVSQHRWRRAGELSGRGETLVFQRPGRHIIAVRGRHVDRFRSATSTWHQLPSLPKSLVHQELSVEGVTSVNARPLVLAVRVTCHPSNNVGIGYLWRTGRQRWVEWTTMPKPLEGTAMLSLRGGSTLVAGGVSRYYACEGGDHLPTRYAYRYYPSR